MLTSPPDRNARPSRHPGPAVRRKARLELALLLVVVLPVFLLAGGALLTGQPWLGNPTPLFGIPAGNLVAWILVCALPFAAWLALRHGALRRAAVVLLLMGVSWLPLSVLLAGNVLLNFEGGWRLLAWLAYSGTCLLMPVALMAGRGLTRLMARAR